jgi:hypothetical protein
MNDQTEEQLDRLTWVGWLLIAVHGGVFAILAPLLLFVVCPAALQAGGRVTRWAITGTIMICGYPCFLFSKWLLEKWGIIVLRPPANSLRRQEP